MNPQTQSVKPNKYKKLWSRPIHSETTKHQRKKKRGIGTM